MQARRRSPTHQRARGAERSDVYPKVATRRSAVVVEDHEGLRDAICEMLGHAGWSVRAFDDIERALRSIRCMPPDVVLTDFNVGALTGPALARELRLDIATREIPIVGMSGSIVPTPGMLRLFDLFLAKPLSLAELPALLTRVATPR